MKIRGAFGALALVMISACGGNAADVGAESAKGGAENQVLNGGSGGATSAGATNGGVTSAGATNGGATNGGAPSAGATNGTGSTSGAGGSTNGGAGSAGSTNGPSAGMTGGTGGPELPVEARPRFNGIARNETTYVAVGAAPGDASDKPGVIYVSTDGVAWSQANGTFPAPLTDVAYGNGVFVALSGGTANQVDQGAAYVSSDGKSWQRFRVTNEAVAPQFSFGNGVFMALSSANAHRSSDGQAWQAIPLTGAPMSRVGTEFAAGVFAAYGQDKSVAITETGDNWKVVEATGGQWIWKLFSVNDRFTGLTWFNCCFGETGGPWYSTLASNNGLAWEESAVVQRTSVPVPVLEDDHLCVMMNDSGVTTSGRCGGQTVFRSSSSFWPSAALAGDGFYLIAGRGILYSVDGNDWQDVVDP